MNKNSVWDTDMSKAVEKYDYRANTKVKHYPFYSKDKAKYTLNEVCKKEKNDKPKVKSIGSMHR